MNPAADKSTNFGGMTENRQNPRSESLAFSYAPDVLKGIIEVTQLSYLFFTRKNIKILQNAIRRNIYENTGIVIDEQDETNLVVIMRAVFLQYSRNDNCSITTQIIDLNQRVIIEVVPVLETNVRQYMKYVEDASNMYQPMDHPVNVSRAGSNTFKFTPF